MGLGDLNLIKKLNLGIIGFTSFLVLSLGVSVYYTVLAVAPADEKSSMIRPRGLSSVPDQQLMFGTSLNHNPIQDDIEILTIGCGKTQGEGFSTQAKHVRIRMVSCGESGDPVDVSNSRIVNRSNGFEATLFGMSLSSLSSDFISLVEGDNHIMVEVSATSGTNHVSEIQISRARQL